MDIDIAVTAFPAGTEFCCSDTHTVEAVILPTGFVLILNDCQIGLITPPGAPVWLTCGQVAYIQGAGK